MKRVQAACICQTLHFFQKDEPSKERNEKLSREEIEKYKKSLEQSKTEYRVLEEKVQDDGYTDIQGTEKGGCKESNSIR